MFPNPIHFPFFCMRHCVTLMKPAIFRSLKDCFTLAMLKPQYLAMRPVVWLREKCGGQIWSIVKSMYSMQQFITSTIRLVALLPGVPVG